MAGAVDVAGAVLGGPARFEQRHLEPAPLARGEGHGVVADAGPQQGGDVLGPQHLFEHG
jgi:hypothetical protein